MTTDDLALLLAETRCEHGRLILEDAERAGTGDDWTVYLRDAAHPCPYEVRDFYAYQTHVPHLPAAWLVLHPRVARHGRDYTATLGALTLPDLARILADAVDPADPADAAGPAWHLHALHRAAPCPPARMRVPPISSSSLIRPPARSAPTPPPPPTVTSRAALTLPRLTPP